MSIRCSLTLKLCETLRIVIYILGIIVHFQQENKMEENNEKETTYAQEEPTTTAGQPLSDFLLQLEDYTPTVLLSFILFEFTIK